MSDTVEPDTARGAIHLDIAITSALRNLDNAANALDRLLGQVDETEWAAAKYDHLFPAQAHMESLRRQARTWGAPE